ncbi:MAG: DUF1697 domain-containing protein, partial [Myxococcales bacterium]|nr:DUF1697 domain-containing protein [Myxococcales bacterium]
MAVQIVLLRGINVGGHRKVPMADLRAMCAGEGFGAVATHVQSGNVVFIAQSSAEETQRVVEAAIERTFGFPVDVVVVDKADWKTLIDQNPLPEQAAAEPKRTMLALAKGPLPIDLV